MEKKTRKIAVVIPKYGLTGGAEGFVAELSGRLSKDERYDVHVLANRWARESEGVSFHRVPILPFPKFLTTISFAFFARQQLQELSFDLIHAHDRIFEADLFTMHGIPHRIWVREVRRKKRPSLFDRGTQWVEKKLVFNERCRLFHAVSSLTREKFLQEYSWIDPDRVRVIHPGVDSSRFRKYEREICRLEIRKQFNIHESDRVILFASMNFDIRGLDHLIKGLAKLRTMRPGNDVKLLVVGKGDRKKYSALALALGLGENVIFAGVADRETLDKIYLASDIFSILSEFDTFSITTLEAMAASLPVLISSNVGAKDLIEDGINGFVIKNHGKPDDVANRIGRMLDDSVRSKMAEEAIKTAELQSWSKATRKFKELYEELLGNHIGQKS